MIKRPRAKRSVGADIIEGLQEAIRFERGEKTGAKFKVAAIPVSARNATVTPAPEFSAVAIAGVRKKLGLTQPVFAAAFSVSPETVKAWEQGKFPPQGPAKRLLEIAEKSPAIILKSIRVVRSAKRQHSVHGVAKTSIHSRTMARRRKMAKKK